MIKNLNLVKKIVSALLVVAVLFSFSAVNVSAAETGIEFKTSSTLTEGTILNCSFTNYSAAKPIDYLQVTISGDKSQFGFVADSLNNAVVSDDIDMTYEFNEANGTLTILYSANKAGNVYIPTDTTELFNFRIKDKTTRLYNLTVDYILCYTDLTDNQVTGSLNVAVPLFGDVNDDKAINVKDLLRYKKFMADNSISFVKINGDLTGNESYGADDLVILKQILLGIIKVAM